MAQSTETLSSLRSEVTFRLKNRDDLDSRINSRLNWTIRQLVVDLELPDFESTATTSLVSGTSSYDIPSDAFSISLVKNTTEDRILSPITPAAYDAYRETETGEPTFWARYGLKLLLRPIPSSDYAGDSLRVRYKALPAKMSGDTDTFPLPDYCEEAAVTGTVYRMHRDLNEVERAKAAWVQFKAMANAIRNVRGEEFRSNSMAGSTAVVLNKPTLR